jgi:hypothetical protein
MSRADVDAQFKKINRLSFDIKTHLPSEKNGLIDFRADLAGLLVVAIASSYENCVKDILIRHATSRHESFGEFALRHYDRLNSKITLDDLNRYCKLFHGDADKFKMDLNKRNGRVLNRARVDIKQSYTQILSWRHDFAHAGHRNTTVEEAFKTHLAAKRVLYVFDDSFEICEISSRSRQ